MKKRFSQIITCMLLMIFASAAEPVMAEGNLAKLRSRYTKERPLRVEGAHSLWPLSFSDDRGHPVGINIDITTKILDDMGIPYTITLRDRQDALDNVKDGSADLSWASYSTMMSNDFCYAHQSIAYLVNGVAFKKGRKHIESLDEVSRQNVIVHVKSAADGILTDKGLADHITRMDDMKAALMQVQTGDDVQVIWNMHSINYIRRVFHMDSVEVVPLKRMKSSSYTFVSRDKELLAVIDSLFLAKTLSNDFYDDYTHWFYPGRQHEGVPGWLYIAGAVALGCLLLLLVYYIIYRRIETRENKSLKILNSQFEMILKAGNLKLWTYDVDKKMFYRYDEEFRRLDGIDMTKFLGFYTPETAEIARMARKNLLTGMETSSEMTLVSDKYIDGVKHIFKINAAVLSTDSNGRPTQIFGVSKDITGQYERDKQQKDIMMRRTTVFQTAMMAIATTDKDLRYTLVNDQWLDFFQVADGEMVTGVLTAHDVWGPHLAEFDDRGVKSADFEVDFAEMAERCPAIGRKSGKAVIRLRYMPIYDREGKFTGVNSSFVDITERNEYKMQSVEYLKKTQEAKDHIEEYIRELNQVLAENNIRTILYRMSDQTLIVDDLTENAQRVYTREQWMALLQGNSQLKAMEMADLLGKDDKIRNVALDTVFRGQPKRFEFTIIPEVKRKGVVACNYVGLLRDISDLTEQQKILEEKKKEADQMNIIKGVFLKNMSYEVRTPLQSVLGYAELLKEVDDSATAQFFVEQIQQNSDLLLEIVNDVLFLSKLDAHMIEFKKKETDFAVVFRKTCDETRRELEGTGVTLNVTTPEQCVVEIDDANVNIILSKLLGNAVKFTSEGQIDASLKYEGDGIVMTVADSGRGIPAEMTDKIFDRFVKTDAEDEGTGLGLSFCKELAEQMGGGITVESKPGKGSLFTVKIPARKAAEERREA